MDTKRALEVLGFSDFPSEEQLRKTYRKLSAKYHPDVAGDLYADRFKEIVEAYNLLKRGKPEGFDQSTFSFSGTHIFTHQSIFTIIRQPIKPDKT